MSLRLYVSTAAEICLPYYEAYHGRLDTKGNSDQMLCSSLAVIFVVLAAEKLLNRHQVIVQ
jgi:hypothetical protein